MGTMALTQLNPFLVPFHCTIYLSSSNQRTLEQLSFFFLMLLCRYEINDKAEKKQLFFVPTLFCFLACMIEVLGTRGGKERKEGSKEGD